MSLQTLHPDRVDETRIQAYSTLGPLLIHALARKLACREGMHELDKLEQSLVRLVEETDIAAPDAEAMKEFAIELVVSTLRNVREDPDAKHDLEEIDSRRTEGRSENPDTLEEQLQSGLEDSFPASDPPAVVSTSISGGAKDIVGTDEVLRRKKDNVPNRPGAANAPTTDNLPTKGDDDPDVRFLAENTDLSPNQARELIREHGHDRDKLLEIARTMKAES